MYRIDSIESPDNGILQEDLDSIAAADLPYEQLRGNSILVTGATGLIGSLLVKSLLCINRTNHLDLHVIGLVRNTEKAKEIYKDILGREDFQLIKADVTAAAAGHLNAVIPEQIDYLFHCAAVTTSKLMVEKPVETIDAAIIGTKNMLELARLSGCKGFVYISSMEVYGSVDSPKVTEDQLGYIDVLRVRSNYPETKRMCENMCIAYMAEYGIPVKIARLAQTFGAGILPWENRVFAQFARAAMTGTDIVLHTKGLSEGNYCYTADCMRGLLMILLQGKAGEAYNVVNEETHTTIADMARMVAEEITNGRIQVRFDIPETNTFGYAADTHLKLSGAKLMSLGWEPQYGLREAYERLILFMQD